jgi:hypothetical protein
VDIWLCASLWEVSPWARGVREERERQCT